MPELTAKWATSLRAGTHRIFGFLQVDVVDHSSLPGTATNVSQTRDNLHRIIKQILCAHDAQELNWAGDGGAYLFLIDKGIEYDEMVIAALRVLDSMRLFNWTAILNRLDTPISLRISCHRGEAIWDLNLENFYGASVNYFMKFERDLGVSDRVSITEDVYDQLDNHHLKSIFIPFKEHEYTFRGTVYTRLIYNCSASDLPTPLRPYPSVVRYPTPIELVPFASDASMIDLLLAGGDSFYKNLSEALELVPRAAREKERNLRILLRRSSHESVRSKMRYENLARQFDMTVEIRWVDYDFMLRGYVFDRKGGFVSYFLREGDRLIGRQNDLLRVQAGRSDLDDFLLTMFTRTFDSFFGRQDSIHREQEMAPFVVQL